MSDYSSYSISGTGKSSSVSSVRGPSQPAQNPGTRTGNTPVSPQAGSSIKGQVVLIDGRNVTLQLSDGSLHNARLENGMSLTPGQELAFLVRSAKGGNLLLAPLMENTSSDPTVLKALQEAGLPVNGKTVEMVSAMMDAGENIGKANLTRMHHLVNAHGEASPTELVQLKNLGIPVNESNIEQFGLYKNLDHELLSSAEDIAEGIVSDLKELLTSGNEQAAETLLGKLSEFLREEAAPEAMAENTPKTEALPEAGNGKTVISEAGEEAVKQSTREAPEVALAEAPERSGTPKPNTAAALHDGGEAEGVIGKTPDSSAQSAKAPSALPNGEVLKRGEALQAQDSEGMPERKAVSEESEKAGAEPSGAALTGKQQSVSGKDMLQTLEPKELSELLKKDPELFSERLKSALKERFSIEPKDVSKENVEKLYEKIRQDTNRLSGMLESAGKADSRGAAELKEVRGSIDFMHDINQLFGYVQLPLKLNGQEANGDLYVFGRKGRKRAPGESVTAFLRLDMENLGPLEVYVSMKEKNVSTRFTVADEEILEFLSEHMEELTGRLEKRGYSIKSSCSLKDEAEPPFMERMLGNGGMHRVISHQAFEVRV